MNKSELINRISEKSAIEVGVCMKVIDAFEEVFGEELSRKKWKNTVFEKVYLVMTGIKNRKEQKQQNG